MLITMPWEHIEKLDREASVDAQATFLKELAKSDVAFSHEDTDDEDTDAYTCRLKGNLIHVSLDKATGVYTIWADTGVTVREGAEADFRSLASICDGFKFKISNIFAVDKNGEVGWRAGSAVRYGFSRRVGVESVDDATIRTVNSIPEVHDMFNALATGSDVHDAFALRTINPRMFA